MSEEILTRVTKIRKNIEPSNISGHQKMIGNVVKWRSEKSPLDMDPLTTTKLDQTVVVISQSYLGDAQRSLRCLLVHIDTPVDCSEESRHPTGGCPLESVGKDGEEFTFCIF